MSSSMFRITDNELWDLSIHYRESDHVSAQILQYWKKSLKTGVFEITRIGLLREMKWARSNGMDGWAALLQKWIDSLV
jgi:hypothetical protein